MKLPDGTWETWISPKSATPYPVRVGPGVASKYHDFVKNKSAVAVIADTSVLRLHGLPGNADLVLEFNAAESSKSRKSKQWIENRLLAANVGRDSVIIAVGGGVTTDLAGFVAATYKRGVAWIVMPTTLLGAVDAAIGGKVGINTAWGKNTIGAFHQPRGVLVDTNFFATLPSSEFDNGLAEMIKHAVLADADYLDELIRDAKAIRECDLDATLKAVCRSIEIKAGFVAEDAQDLNARLRLNFGHTVGHAVEQRSGWNIPHGRAVAMGMAVEGRLAVNAGLWHESDFDRLLEAMESMGLPCSIPKRYDPSSLLAAMNGDKKRVGRKLRFSLPQGDFTYEISEREILSVLTECRERVG